MKKLFLFLLAAGGLGIGTWFYLYGRLPWQPPSAGEVQVEALQDAFDQARQHWREAGSGADPGGAAPVLAELDRIQAELDQVTPGLASRPARIKAGQLRSDVTAFRAATR